MMRMHHFYDRPALWYRTSMSLRCLSLVALALLLAFATPPTTRAAENCGNCVDDDANELVDRNDPACTARADGNGLGIGDPSEGKLLTACGKATQKAGAKLVLGAMKQFHKCLETASICLQSKPGDQACKDKATAVCAKALGGFDAAAAKLRSTVVAKCDTDDDADALPHLLDPTGLGFGSEQTPCQTDGGPGTITGAGDIGTCIAIQHLCRAQHLVAIANPRARELLTFAGRQAGEFPCIDDVAGVNGNGTTVALSHAKKTLKCSKTIDKISFALVGSGAKVVQGCVNAGLACLQTKPQDPSCLPKAKAKCVAAFAKLRDPQKGTVAKLAGTFSKACGQQPDLDAADVTESFGLGLGVHNARCTALDASLDPAACLTAQSFCEEAQIIERQIPRARELADLLGIDFSGEPPGPPGDLSVTDVYLQLNDIVCGFESQCVSTRGRSYTTEAACKASLAGDTDHLYQTFFGKGFLEFLETQYQVADQGIAHSCLEKYAAHTCATLDTDIPECLNLIVPKSPALENQVCSGPSPVDKPVCDSELVCTVTTGNCSVCKTKKTDGASCASDTECVSGFCSGAAGARVCGPKAFRTEGQSCNFSDECLGNLQCAGSAGAKTCKQRVSTNGACDTSNNFSPTRATCLTGLTCVPDAAHSVNGTCQPALAPGATCGRASDSLPCRQFCQFASDDAATGTCADLTVGPAVGSPCAKYGDSVPVSCKHDDTTYANFVYNDTFTEIVSCTCATKVANQGDCLFDTGCTSERCVGAKFDTTPYTPGTCQPKLAIGQNCSANDDCESDRCTGAGQKTCAAALPCP